MRNVKEAVHRLLDCLLTAAPAIALAALAALAPACRLLLPWLHLPLTAPCFTP